MHEPQAFEQSAAVRTATLPLASARRASYSPTGSNKRDKDP